MGSILTGLLFIELFGLAGTTYVIAVLDVAIGLLVYWLVRIDKGELFSRQPVSPVTTEKHTSLSKRYIFAAVLFGYCSLSLEIIFFRALVNYFTMSALAYPLMLAAYLILLSTGNAVGGFLIDRWPVRQRSWLFSGLAIASLFLATMSFLIPPSRLAGHGIMVFPSFSGQLVSGLPNVVIGRDPAVAVMFLFSLLFMLSIVPLTAFFPVIIRLSTERIEDGGSRFAAILFWYTIGNILGTFLTGIWLFEYIGTIGALRVVFAVVLAGAILLISPAQKKVLQLGMATLATILATGVVPTNFYERFALSQYQPIVHQEGRNGVVTAIATDSFYTIVDINRTASASAIVRSPGAGDVYEAYRWNLSELMALDASYRPKNILVIGVGHGYFIETLLDYDFIENIVVVDISHEIVDTVRDITNPEYGKFLSDPRVKFVLQDGRRYLQTLSSDAEHFDLIQIKINEPWTSGASNLFTEEFMATMRNALTPGGYLAMRHHLGHAYTGLNIFNHAIWTGYYHLYLTDSEPDLSSPATVTQDIQKAYFAGLPGSAVVDADDARDELTVAILSPGDLTNFPDNTDNFPRFEYNWLNSLAPRYENPWQFFDLAVPVVAEHSFVQPVVIESKS